MTNDARQHEHARAAWYAINATGWARRTRFAIADLFTHGPNTLAGVQAFREWQEADEGLRSCLASSGFASREAAKLERVHGAVFPGAP